MSLKIGQKHSSAMVHKKVVRIFWPKRGSRWGTKIAK
jgi:hypothetical protein